MSNLTTLDNAKDWIGLKGAESDDLVNRLITACSVFIENWTSRQFLSTSYSEKRSGIGNSVMLTSQYPIVSVASINVDGMNIPSALSSMQSGFTYDDNAIYLNGYVFNRGRNNILISYTAGYASVPADLEQAVIETIGLRFKEKGDRIGIATKGLSGETTSFTLKDFTASGRSILNFYKKAILV